MTRWPFRKNLIAIGCFVSRWHLWKLYGQESLQRVTFWIPFKAVNMKVFPPYGPRRSKTKTTTAPTPSLYGSDERAAREKRVTVFSSRKKRLRMWCFLMETKVLFGLKRKSFHRWLNYAGNWNDERMLQLQWCELWCGCVKRTRTLQQDSQDVSQEQRMKSVLVSGYSTTQTDLDKLFNRPWWD